MSLFALMPHYHFDRYILRSVDLVETRHLKIDNNIADGVRDYPWTLRSPLFHIPRTPRCARFDDPPRSVSVSIKGFGGRSALPSGGASISRSRNLASYFLLKLSVRIESI
jgi:hypothetical protein